MGTAPVADGGMKLSRRKALIVAVAAGALLFLGWKTFFGGWEIRNARAGAVNIVAFGDSLTYGTGAGAGEGFTDHLSRLIARPVVNRGVPGATARDSIRRVDGEVIAAAPHMVIVMLGGNDLLQQRGEGEILKDLETIITRIQESGAMVVLVGVQSPLFGGSLGRGVKALARRTGCVHVPNILKGVMGSPKLMTDRVHPNGEGYKIMAGRVADAIREYL